MCETWPSGGGRVSRRVRRGCCLQLSVIWLLLPGAQAIGQMPPARVTVAEVQRRQLATKQTFVGTVTPLRTSTVGSTVEERVVELLVNEGDPVKQNQPLAQLRTRKLEIELAGARAELKGRKHELAEMEKALPKEIEQAHARMLAAKALTEFTKSRLKRSRALYEREASSEDELQERASAAEAAQQTFLEEKAGWELLVAGAREEKIAQARARVAVQEEEIHLLEDAVTEHTIVAPFDGYVTKEHTEVGQWIAKGSAVVEVIEVDPVDVEVSVPERFVSQLPLGSRAEVEIGAYPGRTWTGSVALIVPQADVRSRSFPVKVRLKNRSGPSGLMLKPGMFARVTLSVGSKAALLVPKDALVLGGRSPRVFVVEAAAAGKSPEQETVRLVAVELAEALDGLIAVRGALQAGQRVVLEGNERLRPGQPVVVIATVEPVKASSSAKEPIRKKADR